jgi:hypothetical protein
MGKSLKYWILVFAIAGFTFGVNSQNHPPEPSMQSQGNGRPPCGQLPGNGNGQGPNIPPPVGLCLPINDYLLPLLISGIALGGFMVWRLEKSSS